MNDVENMLDDLYEQGWKDLSISFATQDEVMINGMTEAETTASASVAGLMGGEK